MGIFESLVEVKLEAKLTVIVVVCEKVGTKTLAQLYATFQPFVDFAFQFALFRQTQLIKLILLHVGVEDATKGAVLFNAFKHQFAIGAGVALVLVEIGEIKICLCHVMINSFLVHLPGIFLVAQGLVCIAHDAVPVWVEVCIGSDALLYLFKHTFRFLVGVVACNTIAGLKHCGELAAFFDGLVAQLGGELRVHDATEAITPQQRFTHQCIGTASFGSLCIKVESHFDVIDVTVVDGKPAGVTIHGVGIIGVAQHLNVGRSETQNPAIRAETA